MFEKQLEQFTRGHILRFMSCITYSSKDKLQI